MKIEQLIEKGDATAQLVRSALNILMESPYFCKEVDEPALERYRFLRKVRPSADESVDESETIYEALPAMWHYQAAQLAVPVAAAADVGSFRQD